MLQLFDGYDAVSFAPAQHGHPSGNVGGRQQQRPPCRWHCTVVYHHNVHQDVLEASVVVMSMAVPLRCSAMEFSRSHMQQSVVQDCHVTKVRPLEGIDHSRRDNLNLGAIGTAPSSCWVAQHGLHRPLQTPLIGSVHLGRTTTIARMPIAMHVFHCDPPFLDAYDAVD